MLIRFTNVEVVGGLEMFWWSVGDKNLIGVGSRGIENVEYTGYIFFKEFYYKEEGENVAAVGGSGVKTDFLFVFKMGNIPFICWLRLIQEKGNNWWYRRERTAEAVPLSKHVYKWVGYELG